MSEVFFFDFDETLYSHRLGRVPASARAALDRLRADGHRVILATGRGYESVRMIQRELGFLPDIMILMNGQIISQGGQTVYEAFVEMPAIAPIVACARAHGFAYGGYYRGGTLVNTLNERVRAVWAEFGAPAPDVRQDFADGVPIYQGHLYIKEAEAALFGTALAQFVVNWSHELLVNLIPRSAGKGRAVRWCLAQLGAAAQDAYAFGDGYNDHDLLEAVGHGVAMGNAQSALRETAEFVTTAVDEDGIAHALQYYGIL